MPFPDIRAILLLALKAGQGLLHLKDYTMCNMQLKYHTSLMELSEMFPKALSGQTGLLTKNPQTYALFGVQTC